VKLTSFTVMSGAAWVGTATVWPSAIMKFSSRKPNMAPTTTPARITTRLMWAATEAIGVQRNRSP
jgi:hypothetical protein